MATRRSVLLGLSAAAGVVGAPRRATAAPAPARDPYSSGDLGPWRTFGHSRSTVSVSRRAAGAATGVRVVGDSVASLTLSTFAGRLSAAGRPLSWDVWSGRPTAPLADTVAADAAARLVPRTLLVVSGANDIFDTAPFPRQVTRLMSAVPATTRVVWVTPYVGRPASPIADTRNSAVLGFALERAAAAHRNLTLVRWFDFLAAKPSRLPAYVPDGVHPRPAAGRSAYVALAFPAL